MPSRRAPRVAAESAKVEAPWEVRKGRERKPQVTEMQGSPAAAAVAISTSESPM